MEEQSGSFAELGLKPELVTALTELGYEAPTPIQMRTIPPLLAGRDVIGQAQTGTGKTAAFSLPLLHLLDLSVRSPQALILAPTRELAMQVAEAIHSYARRMGDVSVIPVYGGAPIGPQLKRLERGAHVVVGTPGRIIDHLNRGTLDLSKIRMLVLDEADEMLRMGFIDDVERILSDAPAERQIALFSATMPQEIASIADRHTRDAETIRAAQHTVTAPAIEQRFLTVSENQKLSVLTQILELEQSSAVLIFRRTKTGAAELAEKLEGRGFGAVALHGDMNQAMRESVMRRMRAGQVDIVVATDVAARGLDVEQIEHVINYDIPYDVEAYVHRIGRTGRAGRNGLATLFVTPRERRMLREIERYTGGSIKPGKIPTSADVAAHRVAQLKESLRKTIQEGDLELYLELVEQLVDEGPHDIGEVAAAALRLATQAKTIAPQKEIVEPVETRVSAAPSESRRSPATDRPAAPRFSDRTAEREDRAPRRERDGVVRLAMGVGRRDGIRPADIVGSIANEADIPGKDIGPIQIGETLTTVGVPAEHAERIIARVARAKFRGRGLDVRIASAADLAATERSQGDRRRESSEGPRRDPTRPPRPSFRGDAPPRSYSKPSGSRDAGERGRDDLRFERADRKPAARGGFSKRTDSDRPPARFDRESRPAGRFSRDDAPPRGKGPGFRPGGGGFRPGGGGSRSGGFGSRPGGPKKKR